jgi:Dockerin type I domain
LSGAPGVECRDGAGAYTFVVTFSNMMATGTASVTGGTGSVSGSPVIAGNTMTVQLTGVANAQMLTVTLANLSDSFGQTLADTPVSAAMLIGDTTGNSTVSSSDISQVKASVGLPIDGSNFRTDVNINGAVSSADIAETKANSGQSVQ